MEDGLSLPLPQILWWPIGSLLHWTTPELVVKFRGSKGPLFGSPEKKLFKYARYKKFH